jgi:hypothetical protein
LSPSLTIRARRTIDINLLPAVENPDIPYLESKTVLASVATKLRNLGMKS